MPRLFQPSHASFFRHIARFILLSLGSASVAILAWLAWLLIPTIPDPERGFLTRKGDLVFAVETHRERLGDTTLIELTLRSSSGLEVDLSLRVPLGVNESRPLVLLLGGQRTGRHAVKLVSDTRGAVIAALSYPYAGDADAQGLGLLMELPEMRQALVDTTPAVLLALDYLLQQAYVDPGHVELAGVSLGAFLVSIPGALDARIGRVWLIHGAGDPASVLEENPQIRNYLSWPPARRLTAKILAAALNVHHLRPELWVGRISPRPVVIVNARDDEALPAASIAALHAAARDPVEIVWTEGLHIMPGRRDIVDALAQMVLSEVMGNGAMSQEEASRN